MNSSKFVRFAMKVATVAVVSAAVNEVILEVVRRSKEKVVQEVQ